MDITLKNSREKGNEKRLEDIRILIIDDEREARSMLRNMLIELGVTQVFESPDGRQGLEFMDSVPEYVDMVICDWNMPKLSGIELLRQLRSVCADIPFLMVTGRSDIESVIEAKKSGVTGYIAKPFSHKELRDKLGKVMQKSRLAPCADLAK